MAGKIPLFSVPERSAEYFRTSFLQDLLAGLSVAVLAVPQSMAFAHLAGLPPSHGLYAAAIGGIVGSACGSSRLMISGPTNSISIVLFSIAAALPPEKRLHGIVLVTMLVGLFQCLFGIARLGGLLRYVSHSVVIGFASGAALLIIARQLPALFGIPHLEGSRFLPLAVRTAQELLKGHYQWGALAIGVGTVGIILLLSRIERRIPGTLLAVVGSALLVRALGDSVQVGEVVQQSRTAFPLLPTPSFPAFTLLEAENLAGDALAVALLGLIQASTIARLLVERQPMPLRPSQEFMAQGFMNMLCAVLQGFAGSGSFVRSALNVSSGARTRCAGVFSGFFVVLLAYLLRPLYGSIPVASLAGVIVVAACGMIDFRHIRVALRSTPGSTAVFLTTFAAALLLRIQFAIYLGVFLSLAIFVGLSSALNITRWIPLNGGDFRELDLREPFPPHQASVINVEGDLFFGAVEDLEEKLRVVSESSTFVVVLRLRRVRAMGSTAAEALIRFYRALQAKGIRLLLCGVTRELEEVLHKSGFRRLLGHENIFSAGDKLLAATRHAVARAEEIIARKKASQNQPR